MLKSTKNFHLTKRICSSELAETGREALTGS